MWCIHAGFLYIVCGRSRSSRPRGSLATADILRCTFGFLVIPRSFLAHTRRFPIGDGFVSQWVVANAILILGTAAFLARGTPAVEPFVLVGGVLFALSNAVVGLIIQAIGLSLFLPIWSFSALLTGWAVSRFGLVGIAKDAARHDALEDASVAVGLLSLVLAGALQAKVLAPPKQQEAVVSDRAAPLMEDGPRDSEPQGPGDPGSASVNNGTKVYGYPPLSVLTLATSDPNDEDDIPLWLMELQPWKKHLFGVLGSLASGLLLASSFLPAQYVVENPGSFDASSRKLIDLVFPHCIGVWLASTAIFAAYASVQRNRPRVVEKRLLPWLALGAVWGLALVAWFLANEDLTLVTSFPLVAVAPSVVVSTWKLATEDWRFLALCGAMWVLVGGAVAGTIVSAT